MDSPAIPHLVGIAGVKKVNSNKASTAVGVGDTVLAVPGWAWLGKSLPQGTFSFFLRPAGIVTAKAQDHI